MVVPPELVPPAVPLMVPPVVVPPVPVVDPPSEPLVDVPPIVSVPVVPESMVPEPVELPVVPVLVEPVPVPRVLDAPRVRLLRAVVPRDERDCVALVPVGSVLEEVPVWPPIEPEVPVDMLPVLPVPVPPMLPPAVPPLVCAMAMLGMISAAAAIEVKIRIFLS